MGGRKSHGGGFTYNSELARRAGKLGGMATKKKLAKSRVVETDEGMDNV